MKLSNSKFKYLMDLTRSKEPDSRKQVIEAMKEVDLEDNVTMSLILIKQLKIMRDTHDDTLRLRQFVEKMLPGQELLADSMEKLISEKYPEDLDLLLEWFGEVLGTNLIEMAHFDFLKKYKIKILRS